MKPIILQTFFYISIMTLVLSCTEDRKVEVDKVPAEISEDVFKMGEVLFLRCSPCHTKDKTKLVGPGLKDITKRQDTEQIKKWIINSQALIGSGDKYANDLYLKYDKKAMPSFALSDKEIDALIFYIEN